MGHIRPAQERATVRLGHSSLLNLARGTSMPELSVHIDRPLEDVFGGFVPTV